MLSNAYFLAKFRFDTAENEPAESARSEPAGQSGTTLLSFLVNTPWLPSLAAEHVRSLNSGEGSHLGRAAVPQILRHLQSFAEISRKLLIFQTDFLRKF